MAATAMATATISSKKGAMVAIRILLDTTPAGEAAAPPWTWLGDKCAACGRVCWSSDACKHPAFAVCASLCWFKHDGAWYKLYQTPDICQPKVQFVLFSFNRLCNPGCHGSPHMSTDVAGAQCRMMKIMKVVAATAEVGAEGEGVAAEAEEAAEVKQVASGQGPDQ
jgi:hypothetical protein